MYFSWGNFLLFITLPDMDRSVAFSVVISLGVVVSKSRGSYKILGPLSKHCKTLVATVFAVGESRFDKTPAIQSNNPKRRKIICESNKVNRMI